MSTWFAMIVAAVSVWLLTPLAARLGRAWGLVDDPDGPLKIHATAIPRSGGVALAVGLTITVMLAHFFGAALLRAPEGILALALFGLGVWDDRRPRPAKLRLGLQTALYLAGWAMGVRVVLTQMPVVDMLLGLGLFITIVNAVNFYDGLDGLLALTAVAALGTWGALAVDGDSTTPLFLVCAAAFLGFLPHNWHPARIFLGDGGSFLVGFLFYLVLVRVTTGGSGVTPGMWVIALPVCDAAAATLHRLLRRRDVWTGDRDHVYDLLCRFGWRVPHVALFLSVVAAVCARASAWVLGLSTGAGWIVTVSMYVAVTAAIVLLRERYGVREN